MIGFIVNPASGNGRGRKAWKQIEHVLRHSSIHYTVKFTQAFQDAARYAETLGNDDQIDAVIAIGGDGTVHEAANGLFRAGATKSIGYIPAGSGNDFARGFGIPLGILEALNVVIGPHMTVCSDVIRCGDRIAVSSIGIGLDGRIARVTNSAGYKRWLNRIKLGKLAYVISLVRVLTTYKPGRILINVDGQEQSIDETWLAAVTNIPYYGGGMMICPEAVQNDGQADLCIVSGVGRAELLAVFPRVYKGTHTSHPATKFTRGKSIEIHSVRTLDIHMDGEYAGTTPAVLEVVPSALNVMVPVRN